MHRGRHEHRRGLRVHERYHSRSPPLEPRFPSSSAAPPVLTLLPKSSLPALATTKSDCADSMASCTAFMFSFKAVDISRNMQRKLSLIGYSLRNTSSDSIGINSIKWPFLKLPLVKDGLLYLWSLWLSGLVYDGLIFWPDLTCCYCI